VNHYADPAFWRAYATLPATVQRLADKSFTLLKADPRHPSLRDRWVERTACVGIAEGVF
jgi:hypothetical protein